MGEKGRGDVRDDEIATIHGWQQGDEQAVRALFENWYPERCGWRT